MANKARFALSLFFILGIALSTRVFAGTPAENAALEVIRRAVGEEKASKVEIKIVPGKGNPSYSFHAENGTLHITATDPVAACRGFYDYIRSKGLGMFGWRGPVIRAPAKWPDAPETAVAFPFKFNQMYNVVTAGYSFPYWNWKRWERELDWLALHGYNMIMAPVATEAISQKVWTKLGMSQQEIDDFTCGPAHAPWHRMGNISKVDGPLPQAWHKDQIALQHKILARMRALGIKPIIQGFAGFVPHAMRKIFPNEKYYDTLWNRGFKGPRAPIYILPRSPLFEKITNLYVSEWEKEFGKGKYFLIDTFNEIKKFPVPEGGTFVDAMKDYGGRLTSILTKAEPNAVWVIQGWIFHYQKKIWTPEVVKALFSDAPDDKVLVLDMMASWRRYDGFYGKPWIDGCITNMGGKTPYTGSMRGYINEVDSLLSTNKNKKGRDVGLSNHSEGIETNEVLFELIADLGWKRNIKLDAWLKEYCVNRYGGCAPAMLDAWKGLVDACYSRQKWNDHYAWQRLNTKKTRHLASSKFIAAVKNFLALRKEYGKSPFYRDDAVEMTALVLGRKADEYFRAAQNAADEKNSEDYKKNLDKTRALLLAADRLLESHSLNRLERWIAFARSHADGDAELADYYEENAKRSVTSWGPPVNDYSARVWSGLIRDFYVPRMEAMLDARASEKKFDKNQWEAKWLHTQGVSKIKPYPNPLETAFELVAKTTADPSKPKKMETDNGLGRWTPGNMATSWTPLEWHVDQDALANLKGVKFQFTKGSHRLDIKSVELVCDGVVVAKDEHPGTTGEKSENNVYILKVPTNVNANNGAFIRAVVKSIGGTDSYGKVKFLKK